MVCAKITKFVLNRFKQFKNLNISLENSTFIDTKTISDEARKSFIDAFTFILTNDKEFDACSIQFTSDESNDEQETTFVEIHVATERQLDVFRKSIQNDQFIFEINDNVTSKDVFKAKLDNLQLQISYSLCIDSRMLNRISIMNDINRATFLDQICQNKFNKSEYESLLDKIENLQTKIKYLNDYKKELIRDQKSQKLQIENSNKAKSSNIELENQIEKYALFKLYHNQKEFDKTELENDLNVQVEQTCERYINQKPVLEEAFKFQVNCLHNLIASDDVMRKSSRELNKLEWEYESSRKQMNLLQKQKEFECLHGKIQTFLEENVVRKDQDIEELNSLQNKLKHSYEEYYRLKSKFVSENPKVITRDSIKKFLLNKESIKKSVDEYEKTVQNLEKKQIELLKSNNDFIRRQEKDDSIIVKLNDEILTITDKCNAIIKDMKHLGDPIFNDRQMNNDGNTVNVKIIEAKLAKKFPKEIIGVLSELFEVQNVNEIEVTKFHIKERLGKYADAIVVNNKENIRKCLNFLKTQQPKMIDPKLVSLNHFDQEKSTVEEIQGKNLPAGIKAEPIEKFLLPKNNEIMKLLMNILKPTVVCKNFQDIRKIIPSLGRKIAVTSFCIYPTYKPKGSYVMHSCTDKSGSINLLEAFSELCENKETFLDLKHKLKLKELDLKTVQKRKKSTGYMYKIGKGLLERMNSEIKAAKERASAIIVSNELKGDENYEHALKPTYYQLKTELKDKEDDFFRNFCGKYGYNSIDDYENDAGKIFPPSIFDQNKKLLSDIRKIHERLLENFPYKTTEEDIDRMIEVLKNKSQISFENFSEMQLKHDEVKKEKNIYVEKFKDAIENTIKENKKCNEYKEDIEVFRDKFLNEMNSLHEALFSSYEILVKALANFKSIPICRGSLLDILKIPNNEDVDQDFNLVREHLNGIDINFDHLEESLKNHIDIHQKVCEMEANIKSLQDVLDNFPIYVSRDEENSKIINMKIKEINEEMKLGTNEYQIVSNQLKDVKKQRKMEFNRCIKVINDEIGKFCTTVFKGKIVGGLKVIDEDDPHSDGIQYFWRSSSAPDGVINENKYNYFAALAFLMGILKYSGQSFAIFIDAIKLIDNNADLLKYFKEETDVQSLGICNAILMEDFCRYLILKRRDRIMVLTNDPE